MSVPPSGSDPLPDDFDDLDGLDDTDPSEDAASDPESARQEAEDALAEIEALADLDEDPDGGDEAGAKEEASSGEQSTTTDPRSASGSTAQADTGGPEPSGRGKPEGQCENCGALLHGPYCSECGQKAADRIVPVWHILNEALEAVFELDMRVLHTVPKFLFLPGRLTKEYINGRRKRYIRPFRLFLFSTFLLFTVLAVTTTGGFGVLFSQSASGTSVDAKRAGAMDTTAAGPAATSGTVEEGGAATSKGPGQDVDMTDVRLTGNTKLGLSEWLWGPQEKRSAAADSVRKALRSEPSDDPLEAALKDNLPRVVEHPITFLEATIDRGPYLMFFMIPIFALLLKLLYVRRGRLYAEHMIFSLHIHAFTFFAFTAGILLEQSDVTGFGVAAGVVNSTPLLYLVLAMAHVYEQGIVKSTLKAFILLLIYSFILATGFALLIVLVTAYLL